ncbi:formin-like protein 2 [Aphis craccivora]|uniref:Formin-like protein 2 n=1 Tax=Aphis craccivora TaxID=307492 RepID=A0A6G0Z2B2_APHCR|nr:formin-like protein 2 [Aphis craccivora]
MKTVQEEAHYKRFHNCLSSNFNPLIRDLAVPTIPGNPPNANVVMTFSSPPSKFKIYIKKK